MSGPAAPNPPSPAAGAPNIFPTSPSLLLMAERKRPDWPSIRRAYVEGEAVDPDRDPNQRNWPSLAEVAVVFGLSEAALKVHSRKENWPGLRLEHQTDIDTARRRRLVEQRADQAAQLDRRALSNAEGGMALIGMRLTHLIGREQDKIPAARGERVDAPELAALGLAARRWLQVKAQVMGQPDVDAPSVDAVERELAVSEALVAARLAEHLAEHVRSEAEQATEV